MSSFMGRVWSTSLIVAASLAAVQADPSIQLEVTGPSTVTNVDSFTVTAKVTNTGDSTLKLYKEPRGLLNPISTQSFKVAKASGNGRATFVGVTAKYSFQHASEFVTLAPSESTDVTHELATGYDFTSSGTGAYTVEPEYTQFFYQDPATGEPVPITATVVNTHTAKLSGGLVSRKYESRKAKRHEARSLAKRSALGKRDIAVTNCAASLKEDVVLSAHVASLYVADAEKHLTLAASATSERYVTWFGEFETANRDRVLDHYGKIRKSDLKTYTYDCECTEGSDVYAYVFPDEFGHVHLCGQYIQAEISGTDSKAGTLVHEATHFTANGGTDDLAYGHTRAQALAVSNSTAATMNADSHEYFAENTPALA